MDFFITFFVNIPSSDGNPKEEKNAFFTELTRCL